MSPQNASGAPGQPPEAHATSRISPTDQQDAKQAQDSAGPNNLVMFGTEHLPSGDAQFPRVEVACRLCGFTHFHIKFEVDASTIVRSPACAKHTEYTVEIVAVKPSAAQRRLRGAA